MMDHNFLCVEPAHYTKIIVPPAYERDALAQRPVVAKDFVLDIDLGNGFVDRQDTRLREIASRVIVNGEFCR